MLIQGLGSFQSFSYLSPPAMHQPKRLRESKTLFHGFNGSSVLNGLPPIDQFQDYTCEKTDHQLGLSFPYDPPDPNSKNPPEFCSTPGSHALLNGNFSASKPIPGSLKLELPSLQYPETGLGSWDMSPPQLLSLDFVDASIQSPSPSGLVQSYSVPAWNNDLLEALLHESENLKSSEKSSNSSIVTPNIVDISTPNLWETGWEECCDPISPISGSSLDEKLLAKAFPGSDVMPKTIEHFSVTNGEKGISKELDFSRPDAILGAAWFEQSSDCAEDQSIVTDAIATFLGEDFSSDYRHITSVTSTINQGWGLHSYPWYIMPAVCQLSEFP